MRGEGIADRGAASAKEWRQRVMGLAGQPFTSLWLEHSGSGWGNLLLHLRRRGLSSSHNAGFQEPGSRVVRGIFSGIRSQDPTPGPTSCQVCDLRQVTKPLRAIVSSSII